MLDISFFCGINKIVPVKRIIMIQLNFNDPILKLKKMGAKRVFVQIPEGLKTRTEEILELLKDFEVIINMDPCFGACDLKESEAKRFECDTILHIGHTPFQINKKNVVYALIPYELNDYETVLNKLVAYLTKINCNKISLVTTVQFIDYLPKIKKHLEQNNIQCFLTSGNRVSEGQLLGCNYSAVSNKGKIIVYFGDGFFHPIGAALSSGKPVVIVNPFENTILELGEQKNKFLRQRILLIESAKEKKKFAILVSTKQGQNRITKAFELKKKLVSAGKKVIIYSADMLSPENLLGINAEVLINTACPRIGIDDFKNYRQIVLNYYEVDYLLGKNYEEYSIPKEF